VQIVQASEPDDKHCHFQFANDILSNVKADENCFLRWIFSDEATFYVSGMVNRLTAEYGDQKTFTPLEKSKEVA
jgi:hypothetical protein